MTHTETQTKYTLFAELHKGGSDGYTIPIDENGDCTFTTSHDGFVYLEDAIWAMDKVKNANYSNVRFLYITKDTYTVILDEDGDEIDSDFKSEKVFDESSL